MPNPIPYVPVNHIENRRLLDAAYGSIKLNAAERRHVHECQVCQGVLYLFVIQELGLLPPQDELD